MNKRQQVRAEGRGRERAIPTLGRGLGGFAARSRRGWYTRGLRGKRSAKNTNRIAAIMRFMVSATSNAAVELVGGGGSQSAIAQIFLAEVLSRGTHCSFPTTATISSVPPEQSAERRRIFITGSIVA